MDKDYLKHNVKIMADTVIEMDNLIRKFQNAICAILGCCEAEEYFKRNQQDTSPTPFLDNSQEGEKK